MLNLSDEKKIIQADIVRYNSLLAPCCRGVHVSFIPCVCTACGCVVYNLLSCPHCSEVGKVQKVFLITI